MSKLAFGIVFMLPALVLGGQNTPLDQGKRFLKDLFPEMSSESLLPTRPGRPRYRITVSMTSKQVIKRVKRNKGRVFPSGMRISKTSTKTGIFSFDVISKGGDPVGSFRVKPEGRDTKILFFLPDNTKKPLNYKLFPVRPKLYLFPLK